MQRRLAAIIIPRVVLKDATLPECAAFIGDTVRRHKGLEEFVVLVHSSVHRAEKLLVTVDLANIPALELVACLTNLHNVRFRFIAGAVQVVPFWQPNADLPANGDN